LIVGVTIVLVTAIGFGTLSAQSPAQNTSNARSAKRARADSTTSDDDTITIEIRGHYVKTRPVAGQTETRHQVQAGKHVVELDTSAYPGLKEWLDKGYLKSGISRVLVSGELVDRPDDPPELGDPSRLVCKVTLIEVLAASGAMSESAASKNASPSVASAGATGSARKRDVTASDSPGDADQATAIQINRAGGLAIFFDPTKDPKRTIVAAVLDAGLHMVDSDPSTGLIFADLVRPDQVDARLVGTLRRSPATRKLQPRTPAQFAPRAQVPLDERPTRLEAGRRNQAAAGGRLPQ
jgi:hypothetical protein